MGGGVGLEEDGVESLPPILSPPPNSLRTRMPKARLGRRPKGSRHVRAERAGAAVQQTADTASESKTVAPLPHSGGQCTASMAERAQQATAVSPLPYSRGMRRSTSAAERTQQTAGTASENERLTATLLPLSSGQAEGAQQATACENKTVSPLPHSRGLWRSTDERTRQTAGTANENKRLTATPLSRSSSTSMAVLRRTQAVGVLRRSDLAKHAQQSHRIRLAERRKGRQRGPSRAEHTERVAARQPLPPAQAAVVSAALVAEAERFGWSVGRACDVVRVIAH